MQRAAKVIRSITGGYHSRGRGKESRGSQVQEAGRYRVLAEPGSPENDQEDYNLKKNRMTQLDIPRTSQWTRTAKKMHNRGAQKEINLN